MFTILKEEFGDLYSRATAVVETRGELSEDYKGAQSILNQLDLAIEDGNEQIIFTEAEVQCLASTV